MELTTMEKTVFSIESRNGFIVCNKFTPSEPPRGVVLFAGGVGIKQTFYNEFLEFIAIAGYTVISFDYYSIGQSKALHISDYTVNLYDWKYDIEAVYRYINLKYMDIRKIYLTHSFGGQIFGLLNISADKLLFIAPQNGYFWFYKNKLYGLFWKLIVPIVILFKSYFPSKAFGMGEDMTINSIRQWRKWCLSKNYLMDDKTIPKNYDKVRKKITALAIEDDEWGGPKAVSSMMGYYTNATVEQVNISPKDYGLKNIGHNGFFKKKKLWKIITTLLKN